MVQQHRIVPAMYASTVQGTSTIGNTGYYTTRAQVVPSDFAGTIESNGTIPPPLLYPLKVAAMPFSFQCSTIYSIYVGRGIGHRGALALFLKLNV